MRKLRGPTPNPEEDPNLRRTVRGDSLEPDAPSLFTERKPPEPEVVRVLKPKEDGETIEVVDLEAEELMAGTGEVAPATDSSTLGWMSCFL